MNRISWLPTFSSAVLIVNSESVDHYPSLTLQREPVTNLELLATVVKTRHVTKCKVMWPHFLRRRHFLVEYLFFEEVSMKNGEVFTWAYHQISNALIRHFLLDIGIIMGLRSDDIFVHHGSIKLGGSPFLLASLKGHQIIRWPSERPPQLSKQVDCVKRGNVSEIRYISRGKTFTLLDCKPPP